MYQHLKTFPSTILILLMVLPLFVFTSCEDEEPEPQPTPVVIPTTYNFENVSYSGQTQRLDMLTEMKNYMATSRTGGQLDEATLLAMYANDPSAPWTKTYEDSKQLKSKTLSSVQADFEALLVELAAASQSTSPGTEANAGVVESNDGAKSYLLGEDGLDHAQVFEKGLMGACFYNQAVAVYMGEEKMGQDNETVEPGKGTDMEHAWDEAFGYFGVPRDFPTVTDNVVFWGNYSVLRDPILGCNQKLMDALLKGRAAISAKDLTIRDEAITEARQQWELIAVGSALHYLNDGIANFDDIALRGHSLSEAIGFIYSLQFNPDQKINNTQVTELLSILAGDNKFAKMDLYSTSVSNIEAVKTKLADYYDLAAQKDDF